MDPDASVSLTGFDDSKQWTQGSGFLPLEAHDELQQLRPHEAELLMGLKSGSTAGQGVTNLQRLTCIGNGWDLHVVKMFIRHLKPK